MGLSKNSGSSVEFKEWKILQLRRWHSKKGHRTSGKLAVALAKMNWAALTKTSGRGGGEAVEAALEVEAEGGGVGGVAELEQEGVGGTEEAIDGGIVGGGAEVGDELKEEGGPGQGEVMGTDDGEGLGELRTDAAGYFEHRGDNEGFDLVLLDVWDGRVVRGGGGPARANVVNFLK